MKIEPRGMSLEFDVNDIMVSIMLDSVPQITVSFVPKEVLSKLDEKFNKKTRVGETPPQTDDDVAEGPQDPGASEEAQAATTGFCAKDISDLKDLAETAQAFWSHPAVKFARKHLFAPQEAERREEEGNVGA